MVQRLTREWRSELTASELSLLLHLVDGSIGYGRTTIRLSVDQIVDGAFNRDGKMWSPPVNLSRRTVARALTTLIDKDFVRRPQATPRRTPVYTINIERITMAPKLPVPKRLKDVHPGAKADEFGSANLAPPEPFGSAKLAVPKNSSKEGKESSRRASAPTAVSRVDNADRVIEQIKARPPKPTAASRQKNITRLWQQGWTEGSLGIAPGLTKKDRGQLAMVLSRVADPDKFLVWSIQHWKRLIAEQFGWMDQRSPPDLPQPGFLLAHVLIFAEAFAEESHAHARGELTGDERLFAELTQLGMAAEAAWIEIGRRKALGEENKRLAADRAATAIELRALDRERRAVAQMRTPTPCPPEPPVVIDHGTNPFDNGGASIPTEFGEFDDD